MILVDSSIWIHHLRSTDHRLAGLLTSALVLVHPMVVGELALGNLADREQFLDRLGNLPSAAVATHSEVLAMIRRDRLHGFGLGLVDAHLLASARLTPGCTLWTRDRRLSAVAMTFDVQAPRPA